MNFLNSDRTWDLFKTEIAARPADLTELQQKAGTAPSRFTVVDKKLRAPSGDQRDYVSLAPYWWPDPSKPGGLPYIRRDGQLNPGTLPSDRSTLDDFTAAVSHLIIHARATGSAGSARRAGRLLRMWFLDAETRMNPHLRYAQGIPGINDGRGIGIIDTASLCFLLENVLHLDFNPEWTPAHLALLQRWFSDYLDWLLDSPNGRQESKEHNNHGTWYDTQVAAFALFCGRPEIARRQIDHSARARLETHLAADGSQPRELARTLSFSYCTFNLLGLACLAQLGRHVDVDLWTHRTAHNTTLPQAIQWMLPYYLGEKPWTWEQIKPVQNAPAAILLSLAAQATADTRYEEAFLHVRTYSWERITQRTGVRERFKTN